MEIVNGLTVAAPRDQVWAFLADTTQLSSCVHGLEAAEIDADGLGFAGPAAITLGNQAIHFPTWVIWLEQQPPLGGRLRAGAQIGSHELTGEGTIQLLDVEAGTEVRWNLDITLPPSLQENRLLLQLAHNVAVTVVNAVFACVQARLKGISGR
jgi:carbon monoxide dehydrogenase subunit G